MTRKQATDMYAVVTDRIIEALEAGVVPWRQPWKATGGVARNLNSGRAYRGINVFLTQLTAMAAGYSDARWATFNGIKKAGGSVRKGEKGTKVILWKPMEKKDAAGNVIDRFLLLRGYTVFNVEQCDWADGIPADGTDGELRAHEENEQAELIIADYVGRSGVKLTRGGDRAFYMPLSDSVQVPEPEAFTSGEAFYSTTFHELVHSTGHETRLNRLDKAGFGSEPYAQEELVAELGASMVSAAAGLDERVEASASYIASWLRVLRDDKRFIVQAAAKAQKAADLILDITHEKVEEQAPVEEPELVAA